MILLMYFNCILGIVSALTGFNEKGTKSFAHTCWQGVQPPESLIAELHITRDKFARPSCSTNRQISGYGYLEQFCALGAAVCDIHQARSLAASGFLCLQMRRTFRWMSSKTFIHENNRAFLHELRVLGDSISKNVQRKYGNGVLP